MDANQAMTKNNVNCQKISLGQLLTRTDEMTDIVPSDTYREVTIRLWGKGVTLRQEIKGDQIAASRRFLVRQNQFILSRIDARNGAFGLVPPELDGAIVSNDFPSYNIASDRLLPSFLGWLCRTRNFVSLCQKASEGSTNRVRLKENQFLAMSIPLPPLSEQRRIVAKIDQLAQRIDEAKRLRGKTLETYRSIYTKVREQIFNELEAHCSVRLPFDSVANVARGKFGHRPRNDPRFYGGDIPFIQINDISNSDNYIRQYSQTLNEEGLKISRMFPSGTVVIAITGATIGATGILDFDSCFPDSIVGYVPENSKVSSEYLLLALDHEKPKALKQATQTTQPNINLRILNELSLVVPSIEKQRQVVNHLSKIRDTVGTGITAHSNTSAKLDALLPSILDRAFKGEL